MKGWKLYELKIAKMFSCWWYPALKENFMHARASDLPFRRTPASGGWDKRKATPLDLQVPKDFPYAVEVKCGEGWTIESLLKETKKKSQLLQWYWKAEKDIKKANDSLFAFEDKKNYRGHFLIFTKKYQPDYILFSESGLRAYTLENLNFCDIPKMLITRNDRGKTEHYYLMLLENFIKLDCELWK